ncbi:MAG: glycosyltransferase family 4 protein [Pseudomonadota bacterium]
MISAVFAVPGRLETPTGGYGYARRLLAEAAGAGLDLAHWPLPDLGLSPDPVGLAEVERRLTSAPAGWPLLIDGLALGTLPAAAIVRIDAPVFALCHHPLALETGLSEAEAARLQQSERSALAAVAHVITTSAATAAILTERYGVQPQRITVARPGTDPRPVARGSTGTGVHLLSVGGIVPRKGHRTLVAALSGLRDLDWRLTIAGPTDRDPDCLAALSAQIEAAGLSTRVRLAGACDASQITALYDGADLFVLLSEYEGYGMAYTEAMAHGLPVLGTATGAVAEATRGGAELVVPGDCSAAEMALRRLIGDREARTALARQCRAAASGFPRWDETARLVAAALAAMTGQPAERHSGHGVPG